MASQKKFGTFSGVLTPSLLTILGVIMYMRLGSVVGNASGIFQVILILVFAFNKSLGLLRIAFNHTTQGIGQVICFFFGIN